MDRAVRVLLFLLKLRFLKGKFMFHLPPQSTG